MAIQEITSEEYPAAIAEGKAVVEFWTPKCGPCFMLGRFLEELSEDAELSGVKFYKLNISNYPELLAKLQIASIPVTVIYADGKQVKEFIGVQDATLIKAALVN